MRVRKHLKRLDTISVAVPVYFVTICVADRRPLLANDEAADILRSEWQAASGRYGWTVGRFVVMPDHVHFFCACDETETSKSLSIFIGGFKQWTAKAILRRSRLPLRFGRGSSSTIVSAATTAMRRNGNMSETTLFAPGSCRPPTIGPMREKSRPSQDDGALRARSPLRQAGSSTRP